MGLVIGSNPAALMAAHYTRSTATGMQTAMERLASGSRINSASDDAAGVSIAAQLEAQARGLDMAMKNAQHSKAAMELSDSSLVEVENMLQRMRELLVQRDSGTYSADDENAINAELDALGDEIDDIDTNTEFNGTAIMGANFGPADKDGSVTAMTITALTAAVGLDNTNSVTEIDAAITEVTDLRGDIGAFVNQLEYRVNNYSSIAANTSAARSTIADTDYAKESADLAKFQILQQAGTAMLAQANASQQSVLALLQ